MSCEGRLSIVDSSVKQFCSTKPRDLLTLKLINSVAIICIDCNDRCSLDLNFVN